MSAYRVEVDDAACKSCLRGATWNVIGPDGTALGVSYHEQDDAEDMAAMLTNAHELALEMAGLTSPSMNTSSLTGTTDAEMLLRVMLSKHRHEPFIPEHWVASVERIALRNASPLRAENVTCNASAADHHAAYLVKLMEAINEFGGKARAIAEEAAATMPDQRTGVVTESGAAMIAAERERQVSAEGWHAGHDDDHDNGSLIAAAELYSAHARFAVSGQPFAPVLREDGAPVAWPWDAASWKPRDAIRNLVRAGALLAAEIDRLQRAAKLRRSARTAIGTTR